MNNAKRQLSKTPDASQEKNFNNAIVFNQSFSADLELLNNNPQSAMLPAFDEEPIAADPDFSEPIESDDEQSLLDNFPAMQKLGSGDSQPQTQDPSRKKMVISYQEVPGQKLRRLSEEAGNLS